MDGRPFALFQIGIVECGPPEDREREVLTVTRPGATVARVLQLMRAQSDPAAAWDFVREYLEQTGETQARQP